MIKKVLVTGDSFFLNRHHYIFTAMSQHLERLQLLPYGKFNQSTVISEALPQILYKIIYRLSPAQADKLFHKNYRRFIIKSKQTERKIAKLDYTPDFVLHVFGTYSPFWDNFDIPYVTYLDYTMALAKRNWSAWVPFNNEQEFAAWLNCERIAYAQAHHLFTMTNLVKSSLVKDYDINPDKITVVGSSGHFQTPYEGEKTFGSKQILFNGSEFKRKGGDLVLAAFKLVKTVIPEAKLVIIGKNLSIDEDGVDNPGYISSPAKMRELFLETDLVVAPAYCEPYGLFLVEAMNYGVPCIVSDRDGMPEIVDHQENGIVVSQLTADILADSIISMLQNPTRLKTMSQQASNKVKNQLTSERVAKNILEALST